jgi:hypothetical protein
MKARITDQSVTIFSEPDLSATPITQAREGPSPVPECTGVRVEKASCGDFEPLKG